LFSLSKAYGMASWRVGYMVIPDALAAAVSKIQDTILICPPAASQHAALGALEAGRSHAAAHIDRLDSMRRAILEALQGQAVPCDVPRADGAFYYLLRVHSTMDAMTMVERLIREYRVATIPGSAFADPSPCSIRISYGALDADSIAEGLRRLVDGIRALARADPMAG
jgi:aspartate/methionine/tyrosine aminotransferase